MRAFISRIKGKIDDLYRVPLGESENLLARQLKEHGLLDEVQRHPGFLVLLDYLDYGERHLISKLLDAKTEEDASALLAELRAYARLLRGIEQGVTAKARGKASEEAHLSRQFELMKVDGARRDQILAASRPSEQNARYGR